MQTAFIASAFAISNSFSNSVVSDQLDDIWPLIWVHTVFKVRLTER